MAASASTSGHLVRPSPHVPWDVSVTSLIPPKIHTEIGGNGKNVASFASCGEYKAIFSQQGRIYVWNTNTNTSTQQQSHVHVLYHPFFLKNENSLRLSISTVSTSSSAKSSTSSSNSSSNAKSNSTDIYVYGWNDANGFLAVWKLQASDRPSLVPRLPNAKCKLMEWKGSVVSMLGGANGTLCYLGTNTGTLVECQVSTMPMVLTAIALTRPPTSLWNRVLGSGSGSSSPTSSPLQSIVVSGGSTSTTTAASSRVYTVTKCGAVEVWTTSTDGGPTKGTFLCQLEDELEKHIDDGFDGIQILQASAAATTTTTNTTTTVDTTTTILDVVCKLLRPKRARIYWIRIAFDDTAAGGLVQMKKAAFLDRFHGTVTCAGLITCDNGMAYAAFDYEGDTSAPVTILALSTDNNTDDNAIHEVDLPQQEAPSLIGMAKDVQTHGCVLVTTPGLVLRARWMKLQQQQQQAASTSTSTSANTASDERVFLLSKHLRAAFWQYYQTQELTALPPSLTSTDLASLESAILLTARQLQQEGCDASSHNPTEWHLSLIRLLQQAEFYKNLSSVGRWTLLGIGQELAIHAILVQSSLFSSDLPPHGLAQKVAQVQRHVLDHAPSQEWSTVLAQVLRGASEFRNAHAESTYDVLLLQDDHPRHLWTHQLKDVLLVQLKHPETTNNTTTLETIIKAALQVHHELKSPEYALVKSLGIGLIRTELKNDKLAHDLSLQYAYYEGLCQLSMDNPVEFSLEPILTATQNDDHDDDASWDDFGAFSLLWFTQQGRYDQVLTYGRLLPDTFGALVKDRLHDYQWVHALRHGQYDVASDALYNINATGQNVDDTEWHLSMAKLAAKVHDFSNGRTIEGEQDNNKRRKRIDNKLDLIGAQLELMDAKGKEVPLQTPDYLLQLALEKLEAATETDDVVKYAMVGLVICQNDDSMDGIATVWSRVIAKELTTKWSVWIRSQAPSRNVLVEETIFGQLWKQVQQEQPVDVHASMQYDSTTVLEDLVMRQLKLDRGAAVELKRLLRSVTTIAILEAGTTATSLLVDSIPTTQ